MKFSEDHPNHLENTLKASKEFQVDTKTGRLDKTIAPYSSRLRFPSPAFVIPCKLLTTAPRIFVLCFPQIAHPLQVNPREKYYYLQISV